MRRGNLFLMVGLFGLASAVASAQTTYPYYQVRDLEKSILSNMRELQATEKELFAEIGMIPLLIAAGELSAFIKAVDLCHQPAEAASINAKIERVNYLQNAIPAQISRLRAISPGDAAAFVKQRSYLSLQVSLQRLEALGGRRAPPQSCKPKQAPKPRQATGAPNEQQCLAMQRAYQAEQAPLAQAGNGKALEQLAATVGKRVQQCWQSYWASIGAGPQGGPGCGVNIRC
jgi:hypothetical protein